MENRNLMDTTALHIIYMLMLKRIGKGYSLEELAWLIGCTAEYVISIEMLHAGAYTDDELNRIAKALDEPNLNTFYPTEQAEGKVYAEMNVFVEGDKMIHILKVLNDADEMEPSFTLIENIGKHHNSSIVSDGDLNLAKDALLVLLGAGYFHKPHTNQEIFSRVSHFLPRGLLSPFYIEEALKEMSTNYPTAVLQKTIVDDLGESYVEL
jgi:hypothetical protein